MSKILVVEDSEHIRKEICEILQFEGFEVVEAENGLIGLEQAKSELPDLIISDVSMPNLNGYELLAKLQKLFVTKSIPFIFLSGKTELSDLRKGMNMGADDYLVKPLNISDLIKAVKRKLKKIKLIKEEINEIVEENEYSLKEAGRMAKIGYWRYNKQTDIRIWSEAVHQIYGTDPKEGVPELNVVLNCFNEASRKRLVEATAALTTNGVPFDIELQMTNFKKEKRWIRNIGESIYNAKNEIIGRRGVAQDITEQKSIRSEIEKVEEMYRLLADHSNDLICLQEPDSTFKYISPSVKNLLGYCSSELLGRKIFDIIHKEDLSFLKESIEKRIFKGAINKAFSYRVRHKKGHFIWLESLGSPVFKGLEISSYVTSSRDVTQAVLAKKKIQRNQKSLQQLTTEITLMEEKQKKDIATNIHDHLSQFLVISKMRLKKLKNDPQTDLIREDLLFIETHISKAIENSRKITYELSPPALYQLGVIEALNWLVEDLETTHKIKCSFKSNVTTMKLDDAKSILLYRSIQEVITNAIKYANASLITCSFDKNKHGIDIFIADNGVGFDTSILNNHNHSGSSFGLFSVQERIRNIQGEFNIESEINTGTTVKMLIPLSK